ncbi:DUF1266 domain-containing protein [Algibacter lectus]|uniref:DUF1266 domain-containing protein n=1 Tax=Algibacter lectus TaxID=221126 RepID=UPI0026E978A6|nr:DUF1266 domain-containing protein [Algibacter lectus]MDO7135938.1 DUF1266 domain-containing protein [Algibacter lectus]
MKILKLKSIALMLVAVVGISCGSKTDKKPLQDETLSSFMLGGIYFTNGYGGIAEVNNMLSDYKTDEDIVAGYKELYEFPFERTDKSGAQRMLRSMWDITNKSTLLESITDLQTRDYKYKSWDYARIINNACMGYASGYLNKEEVKEIGLKTLELARQKYASWEAYYTDFNLGREDWNPKDDDKKAFEELSKNIFKAEKSVYKILPLQLKK